MRCHRALPTPAVALALALAVLAPSILAGPVSAQPTFADITVEAGFGPYRIVSAHDHGGGIVWIDYDRDGWVDLYVGNWCTQHPGDPCNQDFLYRNDGDGTFTDVTTQVGLHDAIWVSTELFSSKRCIAAARDDYTIGPEVA